MVRNGLTENVMLTNKQQETMQPFAPAKVCGAGWFMLLIVIVALVGPSAMADDDVATSVDRVGVVDAAAPGGLLEALLFYIVAGATVISALGVCLCKNIVRMAVCLFISLGSVAMLYFLLAANFLAAIQLIVYAGGTLILLVFGVMLTSKSPWVRYEPQKREMIAAAAVSLVMLFSLCAIYVRAVWPESEGIVPGASVADLGKLLLTVYVVPFEVAGVLLMIVMVGAAHLARQEN